MSVSTSQRSEVSGSALQRLDRLTLRVTDDASLESLTQLAELRNAAFDELEATSGRPWPPRVEEHFTRASGLPEICLSQFNSSTLAAGIYHHGALTVRRFIDAATAHRLRTGIDRTFTARARTLRGAHSPDDARWWTPFIGRYSPGKLAETRAYNKLMKAVSLVDSPQMLHTVLAAYKASGLQALLSEHFGERPVLAANKATLRIVPPDTPTAWHQDGSFMGAGAIKAVNVWLALSACGEGEPRPGLDVVPRRIDHLVERGTDGVRFDWNVSDRVARAAAGNASVHSVTVQPGDALLFDDFFLHRTGARENLSENRYAIETWFFAASGFPDIGYEPIVF